MAEDGTIHSHLGNQRAIKAVFSEENYVPPTAI